MNEREMVIMAVISVVVLVVAHAMNKYFDEVLVVAHAINKYFDENKEE